MDIGLLLLRLLFAGILFCHAGQKLFGWFGGGGFEQSKQFFTKLGHRPPAVMVVFAGVGEFAAALLVASGAATQGGAALGAAVMLVAGLSMSALNRSFWAAQGGGELAFVLAGLSLVVAFTGPGAWSIDRVLQFPWYSSTGTPQLGLIAVGVVVIVGLAELGRMLATNRGVKVE